MQLLKRITNRCHNIYCNFKDFRTDRKIIVFESDDWGSIRVPSIDVKKQLIEKGYDMDARPYERYDTLETNEDIEALYNVLLKYKDTRGNHPIFTMNMVMANPDFNKIKENNFNEYFFEHVRDTYNEYDNSDKVLDLLKRGVDLGVVMPQSHGREHVNVLAWMDALRKQDEDAMCAFDFGMCGIFPRLQVEKGNQYQVAYKYKKNSDIDVIEKIVGEGLFLFDDYWGFKSKTFIAPCYTWDENIERKLCEGGVVLIQSSRSRRNTFDNKVEYIYSGQHNNLGQVYSIRNTKFEPSLTNDKDSELNSLLNDIDKIFEEKKIAVISSHRINYVSRLSVGNRDATLGMLDIFLKKVIYKYPNVEFMSSDMLLSLF